MEERGFIMRAPKIATLHDSKALHPATQATAGDTPPKRYGHIALNKWSSLPRGEEVLTFTLQAEDGHIEARTILKFPSEWERKGWIERILQDLAHSPTKALMFYDNNIEDLLFEAINFNHTLHLANIEFLPTTKLQTPQHRFQTTPLAKAIAETLSDATTALANRKRTLKARQIARGEIRWVETFTDGSFLHQENQGGAAFLRDDGAYGALRLHANNSNETEFIAALIAISSARGGARISINSDCRLVVRTLHNLIARAEGKKEPYPGRRNLGCLEEATIDALAEVILPGEVRAQWVRGHCGNRMNHGADRLAKAMRKRTGRPTVSSAEGIVREATGASTPVSYGFTATELAVPAWYGEYLKNGITSPTATANNDGPISQSA